MVKNRRLVVAAAFALALFGMMAGPTFAQSSDALDQTFSGTNASGATIAGTVNIPTLAAGTAVTGSGSMAIPGLYTGGFTATTLKAMTPNSASGFAPILPTISVSTTLTTFFGGGVIALSNVATNPGPIQNSPSIVYVQLTASDPSSQDVLLYCANAGTMLDIGITLTTPLSAAVIAQLKSAMGSGVVTVFTSTFGTSTGSLC